MARISGRFEADASGNPHGMIVIRWVSHLFGGGTLSLHRGLNRGLLFERVGPSGGDPTFWILSIGVLAVVWHGSPLRVFKKRLAHLNHRVRLFLTLRPVYVCFHGYCCDTGPCSWAYEFRWGFQAWRATVPDEMMDLSDGPTRYSLLTREDFIMGWGTYEERVALGEEMAASGVYDCTECGTQLAAHDGLCYECQTKLHALGAYDMDGQGWR